MTLLPFLTAKLDSGCPWRTPARRRDRARRASNHLPAVERLDERILLSNGDLDLGFGVGGLVTTDFPSGSDEIPGHHIAIQPDGKIVAVGSAFVDGAGFEFAVARYNADGSPDTNFGGGSGKVLTSLGGGQ